jgi:hypothetical protein
MVSYVVTIHMCLSTYLVTTQVHDLFTYTITTFIPYLFSNYTNPHTTQDIHLDIYLGSVELDVERVMKVVTPSWVDQQLQRSHKWIPMGWSTWWVR